MPYLAVLLLMLALPAYSAEIDEASGLVIDEGFVKVRSHCGACHSTRLVTQNRADRDGWLQMIRWMQDSQGLWSLDQDEDLVLDYLARHYGPVTTGRRKPLQPTP